MRLKQISLILFLIFGQIEIISAYHCQPTPPPCTAYWEADVVFIGKVLRIETTDDENLYHIKVEKSYRGIENGKEVVFYSFKGFPWHYNFKNGKYLIYGYFDKRKEKLNTNNCTRTTSFEADLPDFEFFNSLSTGLTDFSIWGTTQKTFDKPIEGVEIEVRRNNQKYKVKSDNSGYFKISVPEA